MSNRISKDELVVSYGFEYDKILLFTNKSNICRSIVNNNPVYCSITIKETNIFDIINRIKKIESNHDYFLSFIDDMASVKNIKPKWQIVIYNKSYNNYIRSLQDTEMNHDKI
jgi:hypothetical protein